MKLIFRLRIVHSLQRAIAPLLTAASIAALGFSSSAFAHHGFGLFDRSKNAEITGIIKSIDFVNPHSYLYLEADQPGGGTIAMRCEMRWGTPFRTSSTARSSACSKANASAEPWLLITMPFSPRRLAPL